jgi:hypothetical protein
VRCCSRRTKRRVAQGLLEGLGTAECLERDVDPVTSGELAHPLDRVGRPAVHGVGGAHPPRDVQFGLSTAHGDDLHGAERPRQLHDVLPDPPDGDHRHPITGPDGSAVRDRPVGGQHRAAEHRGRLEIQAHRHREHRRRRYHGVVRQPAHGVRSR